MQRIDHILILILLLSLVSCQFGDTTPTASGHADRQLPADWVRVTDSDWQLSVPPDWEEQEYPASDHIRLFVSPRVGEIEDFRENVNVVKEALPQPGITSMQYGQSTINQLRRMVTDFKLLNSGLQQGPNGSYYQAEYSGRQGQFNLHWLQRYHIDQDAQTAICLTFTAKSELWTTAREKGMLVLDSFGQ